MTNQRTLNPCTGGSNPSAPASSKTEVDSMHTPPTPVEWVFAPEWLTVEQAAYFSGHDPATLREIVEEAGVDSRSEDGAILIGKQSLLEYQDSLALVLHWDD